MDSRAAANPHGGYLEVSSRLDAGVESDVLPGDVSVDPLFARVGVAFRF